MVRGRYRDYAHYIVQKYTHKNVEEMYNNFINIWRPVSTYN